MLDKPMDLNQQSFLPKTLVELLICWSTRLGGLMLLAATAALWLSLLTWSATDPSFRFASSKEPVNLLGYAGATLSDLLLQIFGLGSVAALSCLTVWGFRLFAHERIHRLRIRGFTMLFSLVGLAGGLSSLSLGNHWAFLNGYGGFVGNLTYNLTAGLLIFLFGQFGGLLAGLSMFAIGYLCFAYAIGIPHERLFAACKAKLRLCFQDRNNNKAHPAERSPVHDVQETKPKFDLSNLNPAQAHLVEFGCVDNASARPAKHAQSTAGLPTLEHAWNIHGDDDSFDALHSPVGDDRFCVRKMAERFAPQGSAAPRLNCSQAFEHSLPQQPRHDTRDRTVAELPASALQYGHRDWRKTAWPSATAGYRRPSLDELQSLPGSSEASGGDRSAELSQTAANLAKVLMDFRVKGEMRDIRPGPIVTLFEFEPAPGTKASRIVSLADDIARSMSAESARIAVIPGRNAIGIELPNAVREKVLLRDVLESRAYRDCDARLPLALGKGIDGEPVIADLTRMPHLLVAGTTGSGKSVGINAMILSLLYHKSPQECRLLMIDPKMLELSAYNGIPHLLSPAIADPHHAALALEWAVRQMENRYRQMTEMGARSIEVFNNRVRHAQQNGALPVQRVHVGFDPDTGAAQFQDKVLNFAPMPYIVIVVDEFADLMAVAGKEIDMSVKRLAQMARAAGIHLIMATQRPSVDVVTGTIKANFPTRIAYKVASKIDSRTIVNCAGAEQLLGQGDLLLANGSNSMVRAHGPFVSDDEVEAVAHALKVQGEPNYAADLMALFDGSIANNAQTGKDRKASGQTVLELDGIANGNDGDSKKIVA